MASTSTPAETAYYALQSVADLLSLLSDIFEGDGKLRDGDFSLSARSVNFLSVLLVDAEVKLDQAMDVLKQAPGASAD